MSIYRLYALWRQATPDELARGADWYLAAHAEACAIADRHGVSLGTAAGVIAALSPNARWEKNLEEADRLLGAARHGADIRTVSVSTYSSNKLKAWAIAETGDVWTYLRGPKVTAFYLNLCGQWDEATIDSHCINAWFGRKVAGSNRPTAALGLCKLVKSDFEQAARHLAVPAAVFQAVIWTVHLRRIGEGRVRGYEAYRR